MKKLGFGSRNSVSFYCSFDFFNCSSHFDIRMGKKKMPKISRKKKREIKLAMLAFLITDEVEENKENGRGQTRKWIRRRKEKGVVTNLFEELRLEDPASLRNWLRMDQATFTQLVEILEPLIQKQSTKAQEAISSKERVAITLRYVATGNTFKDLSYQFRVGERTISYIVLETCDAICRALKGTFHLPTSTEEWKCVAKDFNDRWNFMHCLGAIDGKHIVIQKPAFSGSHYRNYKGSDSIVLLAVVDADLKFRYIDVGTNGRISDGGVWAKSALSKLLENGSLNLPLEETVVGADKPLPFVFVSDDAFPLKSYNMKPYPSTNLSQKMRIFNYRLSRARRCVESAFGIMANRFRVFLNPITLSPEKVKILVMACCSLHNFLREKNTSVYSPQSLIDVEDAETGEIIKGSWRNDQYNSFWSLPPTQSRHASNEAKNIRDEFCNYFVSQQGSVYWQWKLF